MAIYFEDMDVGAVEEFGEYRVTEEEVLAFAENYDPQWFHTDPERAEAESVYGGLIASGWHTASITMRMLVDHHLSEAVTLGAKGVDELRWRRPVRPGDVLSVRTEVLDKEAETDERGVVRWRAVTTDGDGEEVLSMIGLMMYARRGDGA